MQESAKAAGIEINVIREPDDGYWSNVWLKKPWSMCYWGGRPTVDTMLSISLAADAPGTTRISRTRASTNFWFRPAASLMKQSVRPCMPNASRLCMTTAARLC